MIVTLGYKWIHFYHPFQQSSHIDNTYKDIIPNIELIIDLHASNSLNYLD